MATPVIRTGWALTRSKFVQRNVGNQHRGPSPRLARSVSLSSSKQSFPSSLRRFRGTQPSLASASKFQFQKMRVLQRSQTMRAPLQFAKQKRSAQDSLVWETRSTQHKPKPKSRFLKQKAVANWMKRHTVRRHSNVRRSSTTVRPIKIKPSKPKPSSGTSVATVKPAKVRIQPVRVTHTMAVQAVSSSKKAVKPTGVTLARALPPAKRPVDSLVIFSFTNPIQAMSSLTMSAKRIDSFGRGLVARAPVLFNSQQLLQGTDVVLPLTDPDVQAYYKLWSGQSGEAQAESDPRGFVMNQSPVFKQALDSLVQLGYPDPLDTPRDSKFEQDILTAVNAFARQNDRLPTIDELRGIFTEVGKQHPANALEKLRLNENGEVTIGEHNYNFKLVWNTFSEVLAMKTALAGIPVKSFGLEEHPQATATVQALVELPAVERGALILQGQLGNLALDMEFAVAMNSLFFQPKEREAALAAIKHVREGAQTYVNGAGWLRVMPSGSQSAALRQLGTEMMAKGREEFVAGFKKVSRIFREVRDRMVRGPVSRTQTAATQPEV